MISVIIPVKDRPKQLIRAISSVICQEGVTVEVIVVENNSSEPEKVKHAALSFGSPKINYHSLSECANANVARNYGVRVSNGDYIAYLDSDDEYLDGHLKKSLSLLERANADFLYGSIKIFDGHSERTLIARSIPKGVSGIDYLFYKPKGTAQTNTYLMSRKVFETVSWDESLFRHQDLDFFASVTGSYRAVCNSNATVLVNWVKGEKRIYNRRSMIEFYEKWKGEMRPEARRNYAFNKVKFAILNRDFYGFMYFLLVYVSSIFSIAYRFILKKIFR